MKKYLFLLYFLLFNIFTNTIFSKNIEIDFNIPNGRAIFSVNNSSNTGEAIFYDGKLRLNLEEKIYNFIFSSPGYPLIEKKIDVKNTNFPINIYFSKQNLVTIKGNVKNENSNIGGAKITFMNSENIGYNTTTDIFGNFLINIPKGNYKVNLSKENFISDKKNSIIYQFFKTDTPYYLNLSLKKLPSFISGQAIDEKGNSIPYPEFYIKSKNNTLKITGDEFGIFKLNILPGIVAILCNKEGYIENGVIKNIEKNSSITNIEIVLKRIKLTINGIITDGIKPIENATIVLRDKDFNKIATTKSNRQGFYEFYKIPSRKEVFLTVMKNNSILFKTNLFDLNSNIHNLNLILEQH